MSDTDAPKLGDESSVIRSSGPIARPLASFHMLCRRFRWLCITPFGRPVEPDVKRTYARSPGDTDAVEAAAAAVAGPASNVSSSSTETPGGARARALADEATSATTAAASRSLRIDWSRASGSAGSSGT